MPASRSRSPRASKAAQPVQTSDGRAVQLSLPGTCNASKIAKPPRRSEKVLQAQTRQTLAVLGYHSLETGLPRAPITCPCGCKHTWTPSGGKGANTKGTPDLLIYRAHNFPPIAVLVEMKGDSTAIDPAQQDLADAGRSQICHSIDDTVLAMLKAEIALDAYRLSPERRNALERFLAVNSHEAS